MKPTHQSVDTHHPHLLRRHLLKVVINLQLELRSPQLHPIPLHFLSHFLSHIQGTAPTSVKFNLIITPTPEINTSTPSSTHKCPCFQKAWPHDIDWPPSKLSFSGLKKSSPVTSPMMNDSIFLTVFANSKLYNRKPSHKYNRIME